MRHLLIPLYDGASYQTMLVTLTDAAGRSGFGDAARIGGTPVAAIEAFEEIGRQLIGADALRFRTVLFEHRKSHPSIAAPFLSALDMLEAHPCLLEPLRIRFNPRPTPTDFTLANFCDLEAMRDGIEMQALTGTRPDVGSDVSTDVTALFEAAAVGGLEASCSTTGFLRSRLRLLQHPPRIDDGHIVLPGGTPKLDMSTVESTMVDCKTLA